jgi:ABC-type multidrug transport system ATPase subunit
MITVTNLTKRFGSATAVDNVSFEVTPGEAIALWGPNGAGKTTVIRCLLGLLKAEGELKLNGPFTTIYRPATRCDFMPT